MYLKSLIVVLFCTVFLSSERLVKCDRIATIGLGFSETNGRINSVLSEDYYVKNELVVNKDCGGTLTTAPGKIDLLIEQNHRCTWKIYAPEDHHVYVEEVAVNYDAPPEASATHDNSVIVDVYDGIRVKSTQRLYRLGNGGLDSAISSGRFLTINMKHDNGSEIYTNHQIRILYHFIDHHDYLALK